MALIGTLVDTFTADTLDPRWAANGAGVDAGQLYVNAAGVSGVPVYSFVRSTAGYTFAESSLTVELTHMPGPAGDDVNAQVWVMDPDPADSVDRIGFEYFGEDNELAFIGQSGPTYAPIGTTVSVTYDPAVHRWLRITHNGTVITWLTSPDGRTWTVQRTLSTLPTWTSKTTLITSFEAFRASGADDTLRLDNINTTPPVMVEAASTPAPVRRTVGTGTAVTSASFSPPVGALVVALVSVGWVAIPTGTPTLTCTDSLGGTWTPGPAVLGNATQSAIFTRRITTAGALTVTVTSSSTEAKSMLLAPRVLLDAAVDQLGAATATATTSMTVTPTTTATDSWVYVVASSGSNAALIATAATTSIDAWVDTLAGDNLAVGRMTTPTTTPESTPLGWSPAGRSVALEILPDTHVPASSYTLGSPAETNSASPIFRGYLGTAGETNSVRPITRVRSRTLGGAIEYDTVLPVFDKQFVSDQAWAAAIEADDRQPVLGLFADWDGDGQYAHPLSDLTPLVESVSVERTISSELPSEVGLVEGSAAASLRAKLSGRWAVDDGLTPETVGFGTAPFAISPFAEGTVSGDAPSSTWATGLSPIDAFAPYRPDAPFFRHPMIGTAVKLETGFVTDDGPRYDRRFTGSIRRVNPSSARRTVAFEGLDPANTLRKPIHQPAVGIDKAFLDVFGPDRYLHRYNSQWLIDRILRENGIYASPPPHPKAVISITGHGSWIPEIGHTTYPSDRFDGSPVIDSLWTDEGHPFGMLYNHPDAPGPFSIVRAHGQSPVNMSPGSVIGMSAWVRAPNFAQNTNLLQFEQSYGNTQTMLLTIRDGAPGCSINIDGNSYSLFPTDWVVPTTARWVFMGVEVQYGTSTAAMTLRVDGSTYTVTHFIPQRLPARPESRIVTFGGASMTNINVWPGTSGTVTPWFGESWMSQADIDPGLNNLTYIPELNGEDSWTLIKQVVAAEYGACGFSEYGRFWFRSRAVTRERGEVEQITADRNLSDLVTTLDEAAVRNSITAKAAPKYVDSEWEWVFELDDPSAMECSPGWSVYDCPLKTDTIDIAGRSASLSGATWVYFTPEEWETHKEKKWASHIVMCPMQSRSPVDGPLNVFVNLLNYGTPVIYVDLIAPRLARVAILNPTPVTLRFAKQQPPPENGGTNAINSEEAAFKIPGRVLREFDGPAASITDAGSVLDYGPRTYDLGTSRWRQDLAAVEGIGESVLGSLGRPVPVLESVTVPHDPRRRLYGAVEVADPDGLGSVIGLIAGINTTYSSSGGAVDELVVRPIGPPGLGVIGDPTLGILDETLILGT